MQTIGSVVGRHSALFRKVSLSALLLIILLIGIAAGEGTETRISYNSSYQRTPAISGDRIVWTDYRNCDVLCYDTYLYDIATGEETSLRTDADLCWHDMPAIYGNYVVWQALCPPLYDGYDIYLYNLFEMVEPEKILTENTADSNQIAPAISGNWVAWKDMRNGTCDVYLYDLFHPDIPASPIGIDTQTCELSPPSPPSISGTRIVWDAFDGANQTYGIYLYQLDQPAFIPVRISPIDSNQSYPSISGDYIVWQDANDIYIYNISSLTVTPITNDGNLQYYPRIDGNFVVWEDNRLGNSQVFLYDIQSGSTVPVTADEHDQYLPAISGNRIVWEEHWTDGFTEDFDIYMFTIGESGTCSVADFVNASPVIGSTPLTVEFVDQSSYSPTSWIWEFGDGNSSRQQNPNNTYTIPGTYDVSLAVYNSSCRHVVKKPGFVSVENKPTANFSASPLSGYVPLDVTFTDLSIGSPTEWNWDFGDGTTSPEPNPLHQYSTGGSYNVTLIVNNSYGTDSLTKSGYISVLNRTGKIVSLNIAGLVIEEIGDRQFMSFDTSMFPEYLFTPPSTLWLVPPAENGIKNMTLFSTDSAGLYNDAGIIKGNISGISLFSEPIMLEGFSAETGTDCSLIYLVNLSSYPMNGQIIAFTWEGAIPSDYQQLLTVAYGAEFAGITDIAYVVQLVKINVNTPHTASIFLSVNSTWVEANGGRNNMWVIRIGDDQAGEVLPTSYTYHDGSKNLDYFKADSPRGLSKFALSALHGTGNPLQIVVLTAQQWFSGDGGGGDYGGGPIVTTTTTSIPTPTTVVPTTLPVEEPTPSPEPQEQVTTEIPVPTPTLPVIEPPASLAPTPTTPVPSFIPVLAWVAAVGVLWVVKRRK